jgi:murein DD-endopeptidase / murein LD-carboxypeptidase
VTRPTGDAIAERAFSQIGTPFRLHGRMPGVALDCVGLVAYAINANNVVRDYSLKGVKFLTMLSYLDNCDLDIVGDYSTVCDGDVAVVACSPQQFHLMVRAANGWVHSHAGLRKVVHTPGISPWPIVALRRIIGD